MPAHVLTAALFERFASRGEDDFQNRVLSAMRFAFGGHAEKKQGSGFHEFQGSEPSELWQLWNFANFGTPYCGVFHPPIGATSRSA